MPVNAPMSPARCPGEARLRPYRAQPPVSKAKERSPLTRRALFRFVPNQQYDEVHEVENGGSRAYQECLLREDRLRSSVRLQPLNGLLCGIPLRT